MKKRILASLLALSMLLSVTACSSGPQTSSQLESVSSSEPAGLDASSQEASQDESDYYPVTVEVYNNAQELVPYTFEKCPEKTLVYGRNNVEILLALGLGDKIEMVADCSSVLPEYAEEFAKLDL